MEVVEVYTREEIESSLDSVIDMLTDKDEAYTKGQIAQKVFQLKRMIKFYRGE